MSREQTISRCENVAKEIRYRTPEQVANCINELMALLKPEPAVSRGQAMADQMIKSTLGHVALILAGKIWRFETDTNFYELRDCFAKFIDTELVKGDAK